LGAVIAQKEKGKGAKDGEEKEKEIARDSLVRIVTGRHANMYAKVESRDDDNNSLFVRLALGGQSLKVSLFAVQQVSKKEYDRDSKCINKGEYDKEKDRIDKQREEMEQSGRKDDRRDRDRTRDGSRQDEAPSRQNEDSSEVWVRPDLVVRFVDQKFGKGLLFSQKMRVVDVASRKEISLEDDRGNVHYGLRQSWMETVIPRNEGEQVMVVRGRYAGAAAIMEKKDKRKSRIVARLLNRDKVVEVDFDDVCYFRPKDIDDYDD
jgi:transcription antitermination factor NusG